MLLRVVFLFAFFTGFLLAEEFNCTDGVSYIENDCNRCFCTMGNLGCTLRACFGDHHERLEKCTQKFVINAGTYLHEAITSNVTYKIPAKVLLKLQMMKLRNVNLKMGASLHLRKIDDNKQEVIVNVRCNECQEDVLKAHYRGHLRSNRHKINACRFIDDEAACDILQEPDEECGEEDKQPDVENFDGFESSANWDSNTLPPQFNDPIDLDELINNHLNDI
ncbi:hypothetical protein RN001_015491 [Aquatica leii]|uniref:Pacifastin domain-containing protein n=1 Tax=Aquatica leii TaxID=1421715 RepID=A0AAN7NZ45_9COLE|nr:hypothetical protein RN001_015491 [Aquatica leii]